MSATDRLYKHLPIWAQNVAVSSYGAYWHWLRFGAGYRKAVQEYREREKLDTEELFQWQRHRLRLLLSSAADNVPYYSSQWNSEQKAAAQEGILDILPLLSKDPIRLDPQAFVSKKIREHKYVFHTSGSTGTPIATIWTAHEIRDSLAVREVRSANWAGVSFRQPRATFSGRMVVPDPKSSGPFHRYNAIERQVYFSAFHLRPETAHQYVNALWQHRIRWMTGYAFSYYLLAKYILDQKIDVPTLEAVITTSEKLTAEMRSVMQEAYQCRIYEEYSTVENALFASECEQGRLHISSDVGIVEILRPDGSSCKSNEVGEVVTTCLMRPTQPLIRYRLGDLASWSSEPCPCGRPMPVIKEVVGRLEDVITGPDGRQLVRFHGIFVDQPHVEEGQIIQETLSKFVVKVVPTSGFSEADVVNIRQRMKQRLGDNIQIQVECVEQIPRSKSGKYKAVVSLLDPSKESSDVRYPSQRARV